jgi:beta-glucanase (GH16 family)
MRGNLADQAGWTLAPLSGTIGRQVVARLRSPAHGRDHRSKETPVNRRTPLLALALIVSAATFESGSAPRGSAAAASVTSTAVPGTAAHSERTAARSGSRWKLVFRDRFNGRSLNTDKWGVYTGGQRRAENVIVSDGKLTLRTKRTSSGWTYAGVSNSRAMKRTYGKFVIRARLDRARGTRAVALLWPAHHAGWPPEVDFFEVAGDNPARTHNLTANHYREDGVHKIQHALVKSNYTKWHRIGVIWKPRVLKFLLDGKVVAVQRGEVPQQDMWLGLQTAIGTASGAPVATTPNRVDFDIGWVKVYKHR